MDINPVAVESRHERFCRLIPVGQQRGRAHRNEPDSYHERADRVLGACSWFCRPYHSWERGTVESTIGLVRRFFLQKTDFAPNSKNEILSVERWLNNRPRKCLGFKTPAEVFKGAGVALAS